MTWDPMKRGEIVGPVIGTAVIISLVAMAVSGIWKGIEWLWGWLTS